jgi:plastocyanin
VAPPTTAPPTTAPQATEAPPAPTTAPPPPPPPPAGGSITLVALNLLFDSRSLSAAAGPVTVTLDNQDRGIAHNVHFFSKAGSIGMTEIDTGPSMQTLSLGTLAPGAYSYKCDVHPTTMTGILTVS